MSTWKLCVQGIIVIASGRSELRTTARFLVKHLILLQYMSTRKTLNLPVVFVVFVVYSLPVVYSV